MSILDVTVIALGLAADAFAVAVCKGLSVPKAKLERMLIVGLYFGIFQALMPILGYLLGTTFKDFIQSFAGYIAFSLLFIIGGKMLYEVIFSKQEESKGKDKNASLSFLAMLPLAIATSIDAFAVGVTFPALDVNIWIAASIIGAIAFIFSFIGVKIGNIFGAKFKNKAEIFGGIILILIGLKILLESLNIF